MAAKFVTITREEFDSYMKQIGFKCINRNQCEEEFIYTIEWGDSHYMIKVFSSIVPIQDMNRDNGEDAIRVILLVYDQDRWRAVWRARRVHRVVNWRANLKQRIDSAMEIGCEGKDWQCKKCGGPMLIREGKRGLFYGCYYYSLTGCNYTMDY